MRIVLDTNVLISSFIARGSSHKVLEYCIRYHQVVASPFILEELREKFVKKFKYSSSSAEEVIELLISRIEIVNPISLPAPACRDADDDNVLATAITGKCEYIITGDKDLLVLKTFNDIDIINPATFAERQAIA